MDEKNHRDEKIGIKKIVDIFDFFNHRDEKNRDILNIFLLEIFDFFKRFRFPPIFENAYIFEKKMRFC